ncbi:DUF7003 family protein [Granulicella rosea]|nr:hypothetical protein [Granulicella rosea]
MAIDPHEILAILDRCCDRFTFPMLDNGYVYLAATRLSLYRGTEEWAIVIEVFGFSPRSELPDTHIYTFSNALHDRDSPAKYVNEKAYYQYLANNPSNESRFVFPIEAGEWQDDQDCELVAAGAKEFIMRGHTLPLPALAEYAKREIELQASPRIKVFELSRFAADVARDSVLATAQERRLSVPPSMTQIFQLEAWHHPNVVEEDVRPNGSETFQQLAQVLATGDTSLYRPSLPPNTHWRNWPEGGIL